jgi:hypothetical protein
MAWPSLALLGLIWAWLGFCSYARMLHSWRWSLPAIIKGQLGDDWDGADHHRHWLRRIARRRRWCGIFGQPHRYSGIMLPRPR